MLNVPDFIDRDPQTIERDCVSYYQETLQKTLYPAQPERLLVNGIAYRETLVRFAIQNAAEQCLVEFATGDRLDQLGVLLGVNRLSAAPAVTTLRWTKRVEALNQSLIVPGGTLVVSPRESIPFRTDRDLLIAAGSSFADVGATATLSGEAGNGLGLGSLSQQVSPLENIVTVENLTVPSGGSPRENDERLRERIKLAPNQFSVAGSRDAYRYHVLSADNTIIDASIDSPTRVQVKIYPLGQTGIPSNELLAKVSAAVSADTVRPLTDEIEVLAPTLFNYAIAANLILYTRADLDQTLLAAQTNLITYLQTRERKLGQDVVRSQLIGALQAPGVYRVDLVSPATDQIVPPNQWAKHNVLDIQVTGVSDG